MLRTSDEAKNCTCPIFYESETKLYLANPKQTMEAGGFRMFMCDGDKCMAWATSQSSSKGYCKLIFKDGI